MKNKAFGESTKITPFGKFSVPRLPKILYWKRGQKSSPVTFNIFYNIFINRVFRSTPTRSQTIYD